MTAQEKLAVLKSNLQMLTTANDTYLGYLLEAGEAAIQREGITDDGSADYEACVIDYAAYLFRKRAASTAGGKTSETGMPRFLRWQLNNLIMAQKAEAGS